MIIEKKCFSENVDIKYSEMDYNLTLKPSALLNFLQDMASQNAQNLGFGYSTIVKQNIGWFLLKYRMEFQDYPTSLYSIKLTTEPRGYNKLFAYRDFEISTNDKVLGRISSTWSLVDMSSKKLVLPEKILNSPYMMQCEKRDDDLIYDKIPQLKNIDIEKEFEIRFDDIDVNQHVNNCNYIIWAFEPLSFDFRSSKKLKTLDLVFKKEIKYGNAVLSQIETDGNITIHCLKNSQTGEDLCHIKAEWI